MIHRYRIFQFRPKTNVRHPKSPNVRPNTNVRERFVFACTFGHFTELLAISASKVLPPAVGPSKFMHFQCQNCQTFGKMAEHTAKTNILLITETQISMPNLHSDQCTAHVRPEPSARKPFRCITGFDPYIQSGVKLFLLSCEFSHQSLRKWLIWQAHLFVPFLVDKTVERLSGPHCIRIRVPYKRTTL